MKAYMSYYGHKSRNLLPLLQPRQKEIKMQKTQKCRKHKAFSIFTRYENQSHVNLCILKKGIPQSPNC